jgi:hypothetical protein
MNDEQMKLGVLRSLLLRIEAGESDEEIGVLIDIPAALDEYSEAIRQWMHEGLSLMRGVHDGKFSRAEFVASFEDLMRRGREIEL